MNAPVNIKAAKLQSILLAMLREETSARVCDLQAKLREAGIKVADRRVTSNLSSLVKRGDAVREKQYRQVLYHAVWASNDTDVDELAGQLIKCLCAAKIPSSAQEATDRLHAKHVRYTAVTVERVEKSLARLVKLGKVEMDGEYFVAAYPRVETRPTFHEDLVSMTREVIPRVFGRRSKLGKTMHRDVELSSHPRLFLTRGEVREKHSSKLRRKVVEADTEYQLRFRQRDTAGRWRLVCVNVNAMRAWKRASYSPADVAMTDWSVDMPSYFDGPVPGVPA